MSARELTGGYRRKSINDMQLWVSCLFMANC
ncbi:hypothetical protein JMJ77_0006899 [Colletotrichum scovillei]|uniref:Uncharacterized protein n=1 Tax=Colletotrichum scovillei TaxID=1209932 RepID=A0A9P7RJ14_9PEZI|nr:hypothetical protein JMJ77_0006899 [Colletotrichum scovillei]KAG7078145.1 hypothetical protein JMJ76_0015379 [Colletotrichum scovillei]KAG7085256.1 hypothetical protein JMJ78_0010680 [Colletotrichum scovillei]